MLPESIDVVAEEILCYLHSHPNAKDTVEGITAWWLKDRPQHIVEKALNDLMLKRDIKVIVAADGRKLYSALTEDEEIDRLKQHIRSSQSIIRLMEGNTDAELLKKLEKECNDPRRERIKELEKRTS